LNIKLDFLLIKILRIPNNISKTKRLSMGHGLWRQILLMLEVRKTMQNMIRKKSKTRPNFRQPSM
jgi:hypothetical protein